MEWYEKFRVGQKVKVIKKVSSWRFGDYTGGRAGRGVNWAFDMDKTIGKVFEVVEIDKDVGYRLGTAKFTTYKYNYWFPAEVLQKSVLVGEQLLFDFMEQVK